MSDPRFNELFAGLSYERADRAMHDTKAKRKAVAEGLP